MNLTYLASERYPGSNECDEYADDPEGKVYTRWCCSGGCDHWQRVTVEPYVLAGWRAERERRLARTAAIAQAGA